MPYGISNDLGGDENRALESKMEICVQKLVASGQDKQSAIRICKSSIEGAERDKAARESMKNGK